MIMTESDRKQKIKEREESSVSETCRKTLQYKMIKHDMTLMKASNKSVISERHADCYSTLNFMFPQTFI